MSDYLSVQHPLDAATAGFDFWGWRIFRRFIVDHLKSAAKDRSAYAKSALEAIAGRLEREALTADDAEYLAQFIGSTKHDVASSRGLLHALSEKNKTEKVEIQQHWYLPVIRPDWGAIPLGRTVFVGRAGGSPVRARLPESFSLVPSYEIIWIEENGEEHPAQPVDRIVAGEAIHAAPALWDWLFARRLTLLCLMGTGIWPSPHRSPLLLPSDWSRLPRPF